MNYNINGYLCNYGFCIKKKLIDISNRNDPISYFSRSRKGKRKNNIINNEGWHSI